MSPESKHEVVQFRSSSGAAVAGCFSGAAIAIGVPWVLLAHGAALDGSTRTILVWVGVCLGGLVSLTSAFFGLVMPSQVSGGNPFEHTFPRHDAPARGTGEGKGG